MFVEAETTRAVNYYCKCQQRYRAKGNDQQQNLGHDGRFLHGLTAESKVCTHTFIHTFKMYKYNSPLTCLLRIHSIFCYFWVFCFFLQIHSIYQNFYIHEGRLFSLDSQK